MTGLAGVTALAGAALGVAVHGARRLPGGDLSEAYVLDLGRRGQAFAKMPRDAAPGSCAAEAAGLRWLAECDAIQVPDVLGVGPKVLVLAWVDHGSPRAGADEALGRGLALLHACGADAHGVTAPGTPTWTAGDAPPLRLGPLLLPGTPAATWPEAYAEGRLRPLVRRAADRDALPSSTTARIERICACLPDLAGPPEPPARLHGDLWAGNVMHDAAGAPVLVDPAAYGGHREVDLAMLRLFGTPSPRLWAAYDETFPLADGHEERVGLWQLFPLLVHALLFGGSYAAAVDRAARDYA